MFSRRDRLPRAQFPIALKTGKRLSSAHFLVVVSNEVQGHAVVISKKVARLSVDRHRLKRQILAILRMLPLPSSVIVFPKTFEKSIAFDVLKSELTNLLSKLHK